MQAKTIKPRSLAVACALATASLVPAAQAAWVVTPSASVRAEVSDNVQLAPEDNEESGTTSRVSAQARLRNVTDVSDVSAVVGASYLAYTGVSNLDNRDDQFIEVVGVRSFERSQLGLNASIRRDDLLRSAQIIDDAFLDSEDAIDEDLDGQIDEIDVDVSTIQEQLDRVRVNIAPSISFQLNQLTSAQLEYSYFEIFYEDSSLAELIGAQETRSQTISGALIRQIDETTSVNVRTSYSFFEPELSQESDVYELSVGLSRQLDEKTSVELQVGANRNDPEFSDAENGFLARVGLNRRTTNGILRFTAERRLTTGSFGSVLETDQLRLRYRHRFSRRLVGTLALSGLSTESSNDPFSRQNRDLVNFTPEISWRFNENWTGTAGYRLRWTDRDIQADDATSNAAFISLTYRPRSEI